MVLVYRCAVPFTNEIKKLQVSDRFEIIISNKNLLQLVDISLTLSVASCLIEMSTDQIYLINCILHDWCALLYDLDLIWLCSPLYESLSLIHISEPTRPY